MVASGKYFHAGGEQLFDETRRDAEAGSGVLAIGNHQIHFLLRDDVGKAFPDDLPAGRTDDISNEKDAHKKVQSLQVTVESNAYVHLTGNHQIAGPGPLASKNGADRLAVWS